MKPRKPSCSIYWWLLASLLFAMPAVGGCDDVFHPVPENELFYFSIYGYLDVTADTQRVRVTPVRSILNMPPEKPEMKVTLDDLQSGATYLMNDTLIQFDDGFNMLNVWTDEEIEYGKTYRLRAERPNGAASAATITLPDEFPVPVLVREEEEDESAPERYLLQIRGIERLAEVRTLWHVYIPALDEERIFRIPHRESAVRGAGGMQIVQLNPESEINQIMDEIEFQFEILYPGSVPGSAQFEVIHSQIFVASAGPEWIGNIASFDDFAYALPEGFSNIEDGVGYLVGIASKTIPYKSCKDDNSDPVSCPEEKPLVR